MKLNSKVTWGLAWTGLAVVIAIPSADLLTGKLGTDKAAVITSTTDPVKKAAAPLKTASVTTTKTKTGVVITPKGTAAPVLSAGTAPVDKLPKNGKPLPDYISDGDSPAAPVKTDTQVAGIDTVAPTPFPARPWTLAKPKPIQPKIVTPTPATDPVVTGALPKASDPVVVVDEQPTQQAAVEPQTDHPVPPAAIEDDTANWRAQGLARYLDQNGLLADSNGRSTASVTVRQPDDYDADGFYLSDGPNDKSWRAAKRRARLERLLQDQSDDEDDGSFNLF